MTCIVNFVSTFSLLYNDTLFVIIARSRAAIQGGGWGREVLNMLNLGVADQSTVALIEVFIWDVVLILLNDGVSSELDCVDR